MKPYSVDLRQKVIDAYNQQEGSQRQLAKRFRVSLSFIQDILKRYHSDGTIEPRVHGGGRSASFNPEQRDRVAQLVAATNDATLEELTIQVEQHIGVQVSRATMGRVVQHLNLTWKKTLHATERDSERVQRLRVHYWQVIGQVRLEDLVFVDETGSVFVDETGSNLAMTRRYARSPKGTRA